MSSPRILFIVKQKQGDSLWTGSSSRKSGLSNAIDTLVSGLIQSGIDAVVADVIDKNCLNKAIIDAKPDVVVIEAFWVNPGKIQLLKHLHPHIHFIVRNHSEVPFLATEGVAGGWICEYLKMGVEVASVSQRTVDDLSPLTKIFNVSDTLLGFLPNIYHNNQVTVSSVKKRPKDAVHIGCFGAVRELKNHFEQAMGAIAYATKTGKELFFHINGTRVEGNGSQPLKNLREMMDRLPNCHLVEHPWMSKSDFYALMIDQIDLVLQCSLTESFNIIAADAVYCSVPVISSPEIRWLNSRSHCDPLSAVAISSKIDFVFSNSPGLLDHYVQDQSFLLSEYNRRSVATWRNRFA